MKSILTLLAILILSGCRKIEPDNLDTGTSTFVSTAELLSGAQYKFDGEYYYGNLFNGFILSQYLTDTYAKQPYEFYLEGFISEYTYKPLSNLREIVLLCSNEPFRYSRYGDPDNQIAIAKMLSCWRFQQMTDVWGDIPYSSALGIDLTPAYDPQESIYRDLLAQLDDALARLKPNAIDAIEGDLIYNGDMVQWQKFGNALKMRIAIRMSDRDWPTAKAAIEQAFAAGALESNTDNAGLRIGPPLYYWYDPQWSAQYQFLVSTTLMDQLLGKEDPRTPHFAQPAADNGLFAGYPFGVEFTENQNIGLFSLPGTFLAGPETTVPLIEFPESCFILAEALERGAALPGTPAEWYEKGIRASMERWGVPADSTDTYLARSDVAYVTAPGDWKQKIGLQKWLALYPQGTEAWAEWRRLDFGILQPPAAAGFIPTRLLYPSDEQNLNAENYQQAIARMPGGDRMTNKVWWDVY